GLTESVTREELEQAVLSGQDISHYLNFVPVKPGEIYYIPAGTIHAIGKGVTLIEPQQTSETTYRFWDWNRRYDTAGRQTPDGEARELHVEDSFAVSTFSGLRGSAFVESIKGKPKLLFEDAENTVYQLLKTDQFVVEKVHLCPPHPLPLHKEDLFQAFVVIDGTVTIQTATGFSADVRRGQSFLIPASVSDFELIAQGEKPAELIKVFYPLF
ncbi:hypothetical protein KAH55_09760, partial [bacterium]|nr:hypothetical protein [bacterium]